MKAKLYKVYLTDAERISLTKMVTSGTHAARAIRKANILLRLDENMGNVATQVKIAEECGCSVPTVNAVAKKYCKEGLENTLKRKEREFPAIRSKITGDIEARIIQLACSAPPAGYARWTLRLLEKKTVELDIIDSISDSTIYHILKKHNSNHTE